MTLRGNEGIEMDGLEVLLQADGDLQLTTVSLSDSFSQHGVCEASDKALTLHFVTFHVRFRLAWNWKFFLK